MTSRHDKKAFSLGAASLGHQDVEAESFAREETSKLCTKCDHLRPNRVTT